MNTDQPVDEPPNIANDELVKINTETNSLHWFHWLILALSLLLTFFAWFVSQQQLNEKIQAHFNNESERVIELVLERLAKYEDALSSAAAMVQAMNGDVDIKTWKVYVEHLYLLTKYPGINGIGIIHNVPPNHLASYLTQQRKIRPNYRIHPSHKKNRYLPISYVLPLSGNQKAVGLDVAHEENRYSAALKAERSGKTVITGPIILVQDKEKTPGFLLYVPFYKYGSHYSVESRKLNFLGMVYAPFIVKKLMDGVLAQESRFVKFKIEDNHELLYSEFANKQEVASSSFQLKKVIDLYGRKWTFTIISAPTLEASLSNNQPITILVGGVVIDSLLLFLFITISRSHKKAIQYAKTATSELEKKHQELISQSMHDYLTQLPNRKGFLKYLNRAISRAARNKNLLGVIYLDINNFKKVNDKHGQTFGDQLLQAISSRIEQTLRSSDYLARLDGDEFAIIIEDLTVENELPNTCKRLINLFQDYLFVFEEQNIGIELSIGVAMYPESGSNAETLLKHADIAMFRAKSAGKNAYTFYNNALDRSIQRRNQMEAALTAAIENESFHLVYQPQVDLNTREIIGLEVLIRWPDEQLGKPSPAEFIPLAESTKQIIPLGMWILEKAIIDFLQLQAQCEAASITDLSINISPIQLLDDSFYNNCYLLLEKYPTIGKFLVFEITENILLDNLEKTIHILNSLHLLGIRFAIDDFGTGYSSLSYLKNLPFAVLKIDQSFVFDIGLDTSDMAIIQAIISLSKRLKLLCIAEGIETKEQYEYLLFHGCNIGQGFYISKPIPIESVIKKVSNWDANL